DEDYLLICDKTWWGHKTKNAVYAYAKEPTRKGKCIIMHRFLLNVKGKNKIVDHKNHNELDNRKSNLRVCSRSQSEHNKLKYKNNNSGFKGVSKSSKNGKYEYWTAYIWNKGKKYFLGNFPFTNNGKVLAAIAYNEAAIKHHKEFACLN